MKRQLALQLAACAAPDDIRKKSKTEKYLRTSLSIEKNIFTART